MRPGAEAALAKAHDSRMSQADAQLAQAQAGELVRHPLIGDWHVSRLEQALLASPSGSQPHWTFESVLVRLHFWNNRFHFSTDELVMLLMSLVRTAARRASRRSKPARCGTTVEGSSGTASCPAGCKVAPAACT